MGERIEDVFELKEPSKGGQSSAEDLTMSAGPGPSGNYQLTKEHSHEFGAAAYWMGIMGRLAVFFGIVGCLWCIMAGDIPQFLAVIVGIIIGVWTLRAAKAFKRVAEASGPDIRDLVEAVVNLKKLYRLQAVLIAVSAALIILILLVLAAAPRG